LTAKTYLSEAKGLCEAVNVLSQAKIESTLYSIGILASHSLELGLKAFLLHSGVSEKDVKSIGHNINELWENCIRGGLALEVVPYWVQILDYSHSRPYFFRYPQEEHKVGVPNIDELSHDLGSVLEKIELSIGE